MDGIFITFEGIEGCGKTTQIRMVAEHLKKHGHDVLLTREPGGTEIGEQIRKVLLDAAHRDMASITELLLYGAARNQHVREVIRPALAAGKIVLCDRYADATTAYQGAARAIDPEIIDVVHRVATEGVWPAATLLFDLSPVVGLERACARNLCERTAGREDRFEQESLAFHERVREGYLAIARREPGRITIVDANREIDAIQEDVVAILRAKIGS